MGLRDGRELPFGELGGRKELPAQLAAARVGRGVAGDGQHRSAAEDVLPQDADLRDGGGGQTGNWAARRGAGEVESAMASGSRNGWSCTVPAAVGEHSPDNRPGGLWGPARTDLPIPHPNRYSSHCGDPCVERPVRSAAIGSSAATHQKERVMRGPGSAVAGGGWWLAVLAAVLPAGGGLPAAAAADRPAKRPNFVVILVDDLGWSDLGCQGSRYYETPHIDRLAAEGMRFTDGYAAACVCSPTRAALLTGKYPARLGLTQWLPGRRKPDARLVEAPFLQHLPLEEVTIAEILRDAGYATASIGKWHLGGEGYLPENQGFDLNVAGNDMGNPGSHFFPYEGTWTNQREGKVVRWRTLPDGKPGEYLTDRLTAEAERFLERRRDGPFFLYLPHYAVHTPIEALKDKIARFRRKPAVGGHKSPEYAAMISSVDDGVGRILRKLEELRLADDTVVILTSDNGGYGRITSNAPLRGNKGNHFEGGIRVPLIVKWPGVTKAGSVCACPATSTDVLPTLVEMAGLPPRAAGSIDGLSLVPLLKGADRLPRDALFWHYPHYVDNHPDPARPCGVIRSGDWKLIESFEDGRLELFHLAEDIGERKDLSARLPEKARELQQRLADWRKSVGARMPTPRSSP
jgi:arylsulfatase A-like enzyme